MTRDICIVCDAPDTDTGEGSDSYQYDCPNCGRYSLTGTAKALLGYRKNISGFTSKLSHEIRRMQRTNDWPEIHSNIITYVEKEGHFPSVSEQADNLILMLGKAGVGVDVVTSYENSQARVGAETPGGVRFIADALSSKNLIESSVSGSKVRMKLTFDGWQRHNKLTKETVSGSKAFMAMDFSNKSLSEIFINNFKPAVAEAGFDLVRLDENPKAGSIDERLRVELRRSAFIIADLTDSNLGAYWEAGFAEGLGKPVIYTCEKSVFENKGTHFDTNHLHTVIWSSGEADEAAKDLKATIRATLPELSQLEDPA